MSPPPQGQTRGTVFGPGDPAGVGKGRAQMVRLRVGRLVLQSLGEIEACGAAEAWTSVLPLWIGVDGSERRSCSARAKAGCRVWSEDRAA